jgi:hypothetical protein
MRPVLDFGACLQRHRQICGLSQAQLAERSGLPLRSVQNWERGFGIPRAAGALVALAGALDLPVDHLLQEDELPGLFERNGMFYFVCRCGRHSQVYGIPGGGMSKEDAIAKLQLRCWSGHDDSWTCPVCRASQLNVKGDKVSGPTVTAPEQFSLILCEWLRNSRLAISQIDYDAIPKKTVIHFAAGTDPEQIKQALKSWNGCPFVRAPKGSSDSEAG